MFRIASTIEIEKTQGRRQAETILSRCISMAHIGIEMAKVNSDHALTIGFTKIGLTMTQDSCSSGLHLECTDPGIHKNRNRPDTGPETNMNNGFSLNFDGSWSNNLNLKCINDWHQPGKGPETSSDETMVSH